MRLVLQRVSSARVEVEGETVGRITSGALVFVGVEKGDGEEAAAKAARKLAEIRIFEGSQRRMDRSAREVGAEFLVVSQFTLAASLSRGRRPSFDGAAPPDEASALIHALIALLRDQGFVVETGRFGAIMRVESVNEGPVTFVVDV